MKLINKSYATTFTSTSRVDALDLIWRQTKQSLAAPVLWMESLSNGEGSEWSPLSNDFVKEGIKDLSSPSTILHS